MASHLLPILKLENNTSIILSMKPHSMVIHPTSLIKKETNRILAFNEKIQDWITDNILASLLMFDIALIVPLLLIKAPDSIKITLGVISGSWIQWWALPALQRRAVKDGKKADAKMEADHMALTSIHHTIDDISKKLDKIISDK